MVDFNFENLNVGPALAWSSVWIIIVLVLGNKPFWYGITSGIAFFVWYIIISFILVVICDSGGYCFK